MRRASRTGEPARWGEPEVDGGEGVWADEAETRLVLAGIDSVKGPNAVRK